MSKEVQLPAGTRDFLPDMMRRRYYIFQVLRNVFERHGYQPIETPAMELLSTLLGKYGNEGDKLLFKILNSGEVFADLPENTIITRNSRTNELLPYLCEKGLRYDLTVPLARFVVMHRHQIQFPFKRYQIQPVWRADKPQKGRYREFYQCDIDIVGSRSILNELEMITIIDEVFNTFGIPVTIHLNNRKILDGILEQMNLQHQLKEIATIIDKIDKIGIDAVIKELQQIGITTAQLQQLTTIVQVKGPLKETLYSLETEYKDNHIVMHSLEEMKQLSAYLETVPINTQVLLDLSLMRGLDYYTGCIFEVKTDAVKIGSLCGGGRYDNLTALFGLPDVSGIGISFGAERIYDVLQELQLFPSNVQQNQIVLFLNFGTTEVQYILPIAHMLRKHHIRCDIYPEPKKIQKQMQYAHKAQIPFVVLAGTEEMTKQAVLVKDMNSSEQTLVTINNIVEFFKQKGL